MISNTEFKAIVELDLDPIKVKLMHKESGEGWALEYANTVEFEYRRFLYLMKKFPNEQIAPLFDVDVFWHYHILDTLKYAADCKTVFGYFLHHYPYLGLSGEEGEEEHQFAGNRMRELYEATFGDAFIQAGQELAIDNRTAWCVETLGKAQPLADARTAWCVESSSKARPLADTRTAWCVESSSKARPQADTRSAWCVKSSGKARPLADTRTTAWCVKSSGKAWPLADSRTAWCVETSGKNRPLANTQTAWCVVTSRNPLAQAASQTAWPVKFAGNAGPLAEVANAR